MDLNDEGEDVAAEAQQESVRAAVVEHAIVEATIHMLGEVVAYIQTRNSVAEAEGRGLEYTAEQAEFINPTAGKLSLITI